MKFKPYYLFIIAAAIIFVAGFFTGHSTMDIHLQDTYFVFSSTYFAWFLSVLLIGFFLLYIATNKILFSNKLTWIHVVITVAGIIVSFVPGNLFSAEGMAGMPRRYIDYSSFDSFHGFLYKVRMLKMATQVFILAQLLYLVNLVAGLICFFKIK